MRRFHFLHWLTEVFLLASLLVLVSCGSFQVVASPELYVQYAGREVTFMPENELHLQDSMFLTNMTRTKFYAILKKVRDVYTPIISRLGARLKIIGRWEDSTVNAYAYQSGGTWYVEVFGGLARRPEVTADGLALVVCHELGHHVGGFPSYAGSWASSEGQSDYFATQACAKKIWGRDYDENEKAFALGSSEALRFCSNSRLSEQQKPLCVRTIDAATRLARLLGEEAYVSVDNPDRTQVSRTQTSHPRGQCRLDTYAQGAICIVGWRDDMIPRTEAITELYSCTRARGFPDGSRPRCWYKPSRGENNCMAD